MVQLQKGMITSTVMSIILNFDISFKMNVTDVLLFTFKLRPASAWIKMVDSNYFQVDTGVNLIVNGVMPFTFSYLISKECIER